MKDRLKQARKALGLKQREIAERLELPISSIGAWETGKERIPRARIYQLCKEFNINREWLETGAGDMFVKGATKEERLKEAFNLILDHLDEEGKNALKEAIKEATNE